MIEFFINYYYNLWRSKEKTIPFGFMMLGSLGIILYKKFPFDLFVFSLSTIFIQWFCFGFSAEVLNDFGYSINGLFLPSIGLLISLFIFDFIHFNKSLFYNYKYIFLINIIWKKNCLIKSINEYLGGKVFPLLVFLNFSLYYFDFNFHDILLPISIYLTYNFFVLIFYNFLVKYKSLFVIIFFVSQIVLLIFSDGNKSSIGNFLLSKEVWFHGFYGSYGEPFFLVSLLSIFIQYYVNLNFYRKHVHL